MIRWTRIILYIYPLGIHRCDIFCFPFNDPIIRDVSNVFIVHFKSVLKHTCGSICQVVLIRTSIVVCTFNDDQCSWRKATCVWFHHLNYLWRVVWWRSLYAKANFFFNTLTGNNMADSWQTIFLNAFYSKKIFVFSFEIHQSLLVRVQLTTNHHWFRWWLRTEQVTSHYLNQQLICHLA